MSHETNSSGIRGKMGALAASYMPEWRFSADDPDVGSVAAMLVGDMFEDSAGRIDRALHKHRIQYLNLFDPYKEEPADSAATYAKFSVVPGAPDLSFIPKGTKLLADRDGDGRQIVFETAFGITPVDTAIGAVYSADGTKDHIERQVQGEDGPFNFTAFGTDGDNLAHHAFHLGFSRLLDNMADQELDLRLRFKSPKEGEDEAFTDGLLTLRFALVTGVDAQGGFTYRDFDRVTRDGEIIRLVMKDANPAPIPMNGEERYILAIISDRPRDLEIASVRLWFSASGLPAREVVAGGVSQNPEHFYPFGSPMEIYAACEFSNEALERRGAEATISFSLSFEEAEQLLPEYEQDLDYKVIMKRPPAAHKPKVSEVRCDSVLLEYLGSGGWKRVSRDEDQTLLFRGDKTGAMKISFTVPDDILPSGIGAGGNARLRLRLIRADNLYRIPCRQLCPVIDGLRFSYSYENAAREPDAAILYNNFRRTDILSQLKKEWRVRPFVTAEHPGTAQYFGFTKSPHGTPLSLFLRIGGAADRAIGFTAEYMTEKGFAPLKAVDMTAGMIYSEAMLLIIPGDIFRGDLFGHSLYWIRLVSYDAGRPADSLPHVEDIHLNMAKAENVSTTAEYFYLDNPDAETRITLGEKGLISAVVSVNEAGGGDEENWVCWRKSAGVEDRGRVYRIDLTTGELFFEKGAFASFPVREDGPAIRAVCQSYAGSAANIPADRLRTTSLALRNVSGVTNPFPAFGGYDGYNEETSAAMISNMLRTRGRAVSGEDYFDLISQVSYSVRRIKVLPGMDKDGVRKPDVISVAMLIDEYGEGGHIFSAVRGTVEKKLLSSTSIRAMGKSLQLCQPKFIRVSIRLWVECAEMEHAYDLQNECGESIRRFLDPLYGGFDAKGWEIGVLPTKSQLLAYLKTRRQDALITRMVMTARVDGKEFEVGAEMSRELSHPFAMAVNGEHVVYVDLSR